MSETIWLTSSFLMFSGVIEMEQEHWRKMGYLSKFWRFGGRECIQWTFIEDLVFQSRPASVYLRSMESSNNVLFINPKLIAQKAEHHRYQSLIFENDFTFSIF